MYDSVQAIKVVIPQLGLTMTQAKIIEWLKPEGSFIHKGEPLFSLENEKAALDIEAPGSGYLQIIAPAGATVPVLGEIGWLVSEPQTTQKIDAVSQPTRQLGKAKISPRARRVAKQRGISIADISTQLGQQGSGPRGMIVASDLGRINTALPTSEYPGEELGIRVSPLAKKLAVERGIDLTGVAGSGVRGQIMREDIERLIQSRSSEDDHLSTQPATSPASPLISLSGLRGIIAERLSTGWRERPQVTLTAEADAVNLISARQQLTLEFGEKVSYDALLVKLAARALRDHPNVHIRLEDTGIQILSNINIGVAMDTDRGLLVPVVRDADRKSLMNIHRELSVLAERAIAGRSLPDDLTQGTFTITNLGMYEINAFTPIINPPESMILGVGQINLRPVAWNGQVSLREVMVLSLSFDHRILDGAPAARFLQRLKQLIERPFAAAIMDQEGR
jgi:pyruvate dehydrogenase E2 component (dihydrolipoamide acetyltransferase)